MRHVSTRSSRRVRATEPSSHGSAFSWQQLSDAEQLELSRRALLCAAEKIAGQAEALAGEIENGALVDRGGPDALRLLAAVIRVTGQGVLAPPGHA